MEEEEKEEEKREEKETNFGSQGCAAASGRQPKIKFFKKIFPLCKKGFHRMCPNV